MVSSAWYLPEALINFLATRVWNHPDGQEIFSLDELIKTFSVKHMHIQGPIVDLQKLDWYNGIYIREKLSETELLNRLTPYKPKELSSDQLQAILPLIKDRLVKLADVTELTDFLYNYQLPLQKDLLKKADEKLVSTQLQTTHDQLNELKTWDIASIEQTIRGIQEQNDYHRGQYFMMVRLAVTGKQATPPLFETIEVIGKTETLNRLSQVKLSLQ